MKDRRAVLDAGIIILGIVVAIIAIVAAALTWSDVLEVSYVSLITEMPVFEYGVQDGYETGNRNFEIYQILRNIALVAFVFVIMFAGVSFVFEHVNLISPETGYNILSKSVIFILFFFFFPPLWDLLAATIQQTSLWILNPENPDEPTKNISYILNKIGNGIECKPDDDSCRFSLDALVAGITDPFTSLRNMFLTTFLAVFKAVAFLSLMFLTFLLGTVRIVLTAILTISIPVILMLSLLPIFRRVASRMIDAFLGLMIAPIFSALGMVAGVAHLQTFAAASPDPIVEWFAALAVMGLATFIPAMLVPMLGSVMGSVSSIITGAVATGSVLGGAAAIGGARAISGLASSMQGANMSMSGISLAKAALPGVGSSSNISGTKIGGDSLAGASGLSMPSDPIQRRFSPPAGIGLVPTQDYIPVHDGKTISAPILRYYLNQDRTRLEASYDDSMGPLILPETHAAAKEYRAALDSMPAWQSREIYSSVTESQIDPERWRNYSQDQKDLLIDFVAHTLEEDVVRGFRWVQDLLPKIEAAKTHDQA